ncbi:unnamed protein product [Schistosoma mattheei]|uniref:Uncharacterized protein n=1 Tax=Schistosoma mattheei TaxID=31246 RepID=A0A3P8GCY2_9TREM|nr:unnamed protein product [Schistosoma mattheei]
MKNNFIQRLFFSILIIIIPEHRKIYSVICIFCFFSEPVERC